MFHKDKRRAVTLIELVVVVIIVGILASIALPTYVRSRERTMDKQAQAILSLIRSAERAYRLETGLYYPQSTTAVTAIDTINTNLRLDLVSDNSWTYSITGATTGASFTARLTRNRGGYNRYWEITNTAVSASCTGTCP
ncbi:MAG: prepilin-type N-terminal cleavage/methylation domain-containing protein [Candidatus Omnitrophica bacterium]|nr:prepilin-type N-terminal cleavage/methylation domain-containing protein [Candidatus Omnitrophota bacterium]